MTKGKLYGIGVGPGDPELVTVKALRVMCGCDVIAVPHKDKNKCFALRIALGAAPDIEAKPFIEVDMPMTKDKAALEKAYAEGTARLCALLDEGKTVGFLTIGDPTVYSTYCYLHTRIAAKGYDTEIIPGVTSFCACAAALNMPLCESRQELHIIPGTYKPSEALGYPGVKVLMKNNIPGTLKAAREQGLSVKMVENCTLPEQRVYNSLDEIPENAGYYSVMIIKEDMK